MKIDNLNTCFTYLTDKELHILEELAQKENTSVSNVIRSIIYNSIEDKLPPALTIDWVGL